MLPWQGLNKSTQLNAMVNQVMLIRLNKSQPRTDLGPWGQKAALSVADLSWKQIFGIVQRGARG